jgi:Protein of unknown function (DUF4019)
MSIKEKTTIAQENVDKWLDLIDNSKYADSWSQTADYFQNNVSQAEWGKTLQGVRQPLGNILSRKIESVHSTTTLPGVPDGEYIVLQYNTSFENKQSAVETVTSMLDKNNKWRVAGYFIK